MRHHGSLILSRLMFRSGIIAGSAVLVLVGVRLLWGMEANARMAVAQQKVAARGLVLAPEGAKVPDDQNAAVALLAAFRQRNLEGLDFGMRGEGRGMSFGRGFFWSPGDTGHLQSLLGANRKAFEAIDRAGELQQVKWNVSPDAAMHPDDDHSTIAAAMEMRFLLRVAAERAHQNGDDLTAFQNLDRMLVIGRIFAAGPFLANQSTADVVRSDVAQLVDRWGPTVKLKGEMGMLARTVVRELTENPLPGRIAAAFEYETLTYQDSVLEEVPGLREWWLRPLAVDATSRRMALQLELLPIVRATNWQELADTHAPYLSTAGNLNVMVFGLSSPSYSIAEVMRYHFRAATDCRAAGVLLGAELYCAERGTFPEKLEEFVPSHLAAAPVDPFAADGRRLRYRLDHDGPTVWSVGQNGKDEEAVPDMSLIGGGSGGGPGGAMAGPMTMPARGHVGFRMGGGFGFGYGSGRRYFQPDIVYGAAWRAWMASWATSMGR